MSVTSVTQAIKTAIQNGDTVAGRCLVKPRISLESAEDIVKSAGTYLVAGERSAIKQLIDRMGEVKVDPKTGELSAEDSIKNQAKAKLQSALALPKMPTSIRAKLIKAELDAQPRKAGQTCGSVWTLLIPGACAAAVVGAVSTSEKDAAELID